jgi:hypothetical protein
MKRSHEEDFPRGGGGGGGGGGDEAPRRAKKRVLALPRLDTEARRCARFLWRCAAHSGCFRRRL